MPSQYLIAMSYNSIQYAYLFDELDWSPAEMGRTNYEPYYLYALVQSHPAQVESAYHRFMTYAEQHPDELNILLNPIGNMGP